MRGSLTPPSGRDAPPQRPSRVSARILVGPLAERTYKNPTEDASPARGGGRARNWRPSRGVSPARGGGRRRTRPARGGGGPRPARGGGGQFRPNSERINCVRNLCDLRRIFVGSLSERSSPSESSLANSGAIRSDGRKNPSVGFLRPQKS